MHLDVTDLEFVFNTQACLETTITSSGYPKINQIRTASGIAAIVDLQRLRFASFIGLDHGLDKSNEDTVVSKQAYVDPIHSRVSMNVYGSM